MGIFSNFLKRKPTNQGTSAKSRGKPTAMQVYFSDHFGYILCAETTITGTPIRTVMEPVITLESSATAATLGDGILDSLKTSEAARPITREELGQFRFWQISGDQRLCQLQ